MNQTTIDWSFIIKDRIVEDKGVAVLGSLKIGNITKEAWGSSYREGKTLGDALKSSASLSLCKCCLLFAGHARYLQYSITRDTSRTEG